jgi:hypothetical protein
MLKKIVKKEKEFASSKNVRIFAVRFVGQNGP